MANSLPIHIQMLHCVPIVLMMVDNSRVASLPIEATMILIENRKWQNLTGVYREYNRGARGLFLLKGFQFLPIYLFLFS
ncbi:hypothetical protein D4R78_04140 [bacterium]|nr:MAG: hypothetical protein D4R78_04140 [bacterium]